MGFEVTMWQLPKAAAQRALQIEKGLNINPPTRGWTDGVALTKPSTPKLIRTHEVMSSGGGGGAEQIPGFFLKRFTRRVSGYTLPTLGVVLW